jgi:hypothetical protein
LLGLIYTEHHRKELEEAELGEGVNGVNMASQAEAEPQEEEAELGEDEDGLDHPEQVEDGVLVEQLQDGRPVPPPAHHGHLLPHPFPLPPAAHRWFL